MKDSKIIDEKHQFDEQKQNPNEFSIRVKRNSFAKALSVTSSSLED